MAQYLCKNYGNCANADDRRKFTLPNTGTPACKGCGRSEYLKKIVEGRSGQRSNKMLYIAFVSIVFFAIGLWIFQPWKLMESGELQSVFSTVSSVKPSPQPPIPSLDPSPNIQPVLPVFPGLFGVIEIGGKGVKGFVADLVIAENDPKCQIDEDAFANCLIRKKLNSDNVNPIKPGAIEDVAKAAKKMMDLMTGEYLVDPRQVYVVASSSVFKAPHYESLKKAIEDRLNKPGELDFVSADKEAGYALQGALNLVPRHWREKRKKQVLLLDIGSGNTKVAYYEFADETRLNSFEIPNGTTHFSDEINEQRGSGSFKDLSAKLRQTVLRPAIKEAMERKQGIANHDRIYLIGGISWALNGLTQPRNKQKFPRVFPAHIDTLYDRAVASNALQHLCTGNPDRRDNPDIGKICETFTIDNLIAGLDLLKTFSEEMKFENKTVFFMRDSLYAWPLGYLKARCEAEGKCINKY